MHILHDQIGVQAHSDWFGFPSVMASEEIQRYPELWLLEKHDDLASATRYAAAFFPDHEIEQVRPRLYRLTRP